VTPGHRAYAPDDNFLAKPGGYWKHQSGTWYARTPSGELANLARHQVTEHEDGTISVSPSILISSHDTSWHGFLEHGNWRRV